MTKEEFLKTKKSLLSELEGHKKRINTQYSKAVRAYIKNNTDVKIGKVYETTVGRKNVRFVVYNTDIRVIDSKIGHLFINAGGWILNKESVPTKCKSFVIAGSVSNPQELTLSKDQTNHPPNDFFKPLSKTKN